MDEDCLNNTHYFGCDSKTIEKKRELTNTFFYILLIVNTLRYSLIRNKHNDILTINYTGSYKNRSDFVIMHMLRYALIS